MRLIIYVYTLATHVDKVEERACDLKSKGGEKEIDEFVPRVIGEGNNDYFHRS